MSTNHHHSIVPHYLNCIAFLAQTTRMCTTCYYQYYNDDLTHAEVLITFGVDLKLIKVLGHHWKLEIQFLGNQQAKAYSFEKRWRLFEKYGYQVLCCCECNQEQYFDSIDDLFQNSWYDEIHDGTYCWDCYQKRVYKLKEQLYQDYLHQQNLGPNLSRTKNEFTFR